MRSSNAAVKALVDAPGFAGSSRADVRALVRASRETTLPRRWPLIAEGTPADACYVLLEGRVRVVQDDEERAVLGPGAVIGEMGLLGRSLRTASVLTVDRIRALRIEYDALARLLEGRPGLARAFDRAYDAHLAADGQGER